MNKNYKTFIYWTLYSITFLVVSLICVYQIKDFILTLNDNKIEIVEETIVEDEVEEVIEITVIDFDAQLKDLMKSKNPNITEDTMNNILEYTKKYTIDFDQYLLMVCLYSVESNFKVRAKSYLGEQYGRGLGQVSEIALTQYNWKNNTNIQPEELFDIETNIKISCWLYNFYKNHYELNDLETCMSYNKGVNGYRKNPSDTRYYDKIQTELAKLM